MYNPSLVFILKCNHPKKEISLLRTDRKISNLRSVIIGSIIMQLFQIITINIGTQLTTTLWFKRLKANNHTLSKKILKRRIELDKSRKLLVVQTISHSNP